MNKGARYDSITLKLWYEGSFGKEDNGMVYMGNKWRTVEIDIDVMCWFTLVEEAEKTGFKKGVDGIFFMSVSEGLQRALDDRHSNLICEQAVTVKLGEVFIVSAFDVSHVLDLIDSGCGMSLVKQSAKFTNEVGAEVGEECELVANEVGHYYLDVRDDDSNDIAYVPERGSEDSESESDPDLVDEFDLHNHVMMDGELSNDDDELDEARLRQKTWNSNALQIAYQLKQQAGECSLVGQEKSIGCVFKSPDSGHVSDYDGSGDEQHTPPNSDSESVPGKRTSSHIPEVGKHIDMAKLKWCVGMSFPTREAFRDCMNTYAVIQGRDVKIGVSDNQCRQKLGVTCRDSCPFRVYGSWDSKRGSFLVKAVHAEHTCTRNMKRNRQLKSTWLAKQFLDVFKASHIGLLRT